MVKIKHKIAVPFMSMIILLPLISLLVFNITLNVYVLKNSRNQLTSAIETTNRLIRQQIKSEDEVISVIQKLTGILKTSEIATNTEIVIYGRQGRLLYPKNIQPDSVLSENVFSALRNFDFENKQIQTLKVENRKFLIARSNTKQTNFKLIYVLSIDSTMKLIKVINLILIGIMAAATLFTLIIALIVAENISKPIKEVSLAAKKIGKGQFINIKPNQTSEEINELYKSINNMSNSLQQVENTQRTFLQNASHELRTPLMSIQGYAEGIMNGVFTDNCSASKIIIDESKRLTKLVEQLLMLSRIENKAFELNMSNVNLSDLMKDYIQKIDGLALKQHKLIKYEPVNEELTINVDEMLLSQAVLNIASNGIRHAKSMIEIAIASKPGFAQILIRNDGEGISKEDLPHIFDRFYKGRNGNTGLGLSIAKSSIDLLGGELKANNWEQGAEFIINLPVEG